MPGAFQVTPASLGALASAVGAVRDQLERTPDLGADHAGDLLV